MPSIPFDIAQIGDLNARSLGGNVETPEVGNRYAGQALGGLADSLGQAARSVDAVMDQQRENNAASITASSSFTPHYLQMKQNMPADGSGFVDNVGAAYDQHVSNVTNDIEDPVVRQSVRNSLLRQKAGYMDEAATSAFGAQQQNAKTVASTGLTSVLNDVSAQPTDAQRDMSLTSGYGVIDAQPLPAAQKMAMKQTFRQQVYFNQANAMIGRAATTNDIANFQQYLGQDSVRQSMNPQQYDHLQRLAFTRGRTFARHESVGMTMQAQSLRQDAAAGIDVSDGVRQLENSPGLSNNPHAQQLVAEAKDIQNTRTTYANAPLTVLQDALTSSLHPQVAAGSAPAYTAGLDHGTTEDLNSVADTTGTPASFLAGMVHNEYGKYLASGDYSKGADNGGSAVGISQMQPAAWLDTVRANSDAFGAALRPPVSGGALTSRSDSELLALRTDRKLNLLGAGFYAKNNADIYRNTFGAEPTDGDLYVMHNLGPSGGVKLIQAKNNTPDAQATSVVSPGAVAGNSPFFTRNGQALSAADAYNTMTSGMSLSPYRVSAGRIQVIKGLIAQQTRQYNADPAQLAINQNAPGMAALDNTPQSWAQRGSAMAQFATQQGTIGANGRTLQPVKPLTNAEANGISQQLQNPDTDAQTKMSTLMNVYRLGSPSMVQAALQQIGEKDPVALYAARTANRGDAQTGYGIFTGRAMMNKNPALAKSLGLTDQNIGEQFYGSDGVGDALSMLPPDAGGASIDRTVQNAATMLYAFNAHGMGLRPSESGSGPINADAWKASINKILGAAPGHDAVQSYNGVQTLMPYGVDQQAIGSFMSSATPADIARVSASGAQPMLAATPSHPAVAAPMSVIRGASLKAVGGGYYAMIASDGTVLTTGKPATQFDGTPTSGFMQPYLVKLNTDTMTKQATGRALPQAIGSPYTGPKQQAMRPGVKLPIAQEDDAPVNSTPSAPVQDTMEQDMEDNQFAAAQDAGEQQ